jgi:hypothetical protein
MAHGVACLKVTCINKVVMGSSYATMNSLLCLTFLQTEAADQVDLVEKLVTEHQQQSPRGMKSFTSVKVWPDCFGKRRFVSAIRC